ncbi:hypothetical protein TNCV_149011 [Trichonephila clavipes]|nr:hypothetical protein TNCV_149011 [Trichonephila clavipes]
MTIQMPFSSLILGLRIRDLPSTALELSQSAMLRSSGVQKRQAVTPKDHGGPPVDRDRRNAHPDFKVFISARAKEEARLNETFAQAELRMLEQAEREAAHRAAETPEQSQGRRRRHAEYLASQRAAETPEQSQARRFQHATYMASQRDTETIEREKQLNLANVLLLKGHNSDV